MNIQDIIRSLVGYHVASNHRLWDHLMKHMTDEQFTQPIEYSHGSIRNQVVHLVVTDHYWLHDVQSKPVTGLNPQDYPTRASFAATLQEIEDALLSYVHTLTDSDLEEVPGGLMEKRWEALVHVVNHGTDHRAQILSMLHRLGVPTFGQDFPDHLRSQRWVTVADVLKLMHFWYARWHQALELIPKEKRQEPVVEERSVKDILTHLTWYEHEMLYMLKEHKLASSELWHLPQDERNRRIYEQLRPQPLEKALEEHRQIHVALLHEFEGLKDEDLNDLSHVEGMPVNSKLWEVLEKFTWFHYLLHSEELWALLNRGRI